jgi:hypothetical protein
LSNKGSTKSAVKPGDWLCFYASGKGVVAHARVMSGPERKTHPQVDSRRYPWLVSLEESSLYIRHPRVINTALRSQLDAFQHRAPDGRWSWFVQRARRVSRHDFMMLTRQEHTASCVGGASVRVAMQGSGSTIAVSEEQGADSPALCIHGANEHAARCQRGHDGPMNSKRLARHGSHLPAAWTLPCPHPQSTARMG